MLMGDDLSAL